MPPPAFDAPTIWAHGSVRPDKSNPRSCAAAEMASSNAVRSGQKSGCRLLAEARQSRRGSCCTIPNQSSFWRDGIENLSDRCPILSYPFGVVLVMGPRPKETILHLQAVDLVPHAHRGYRSEEHTSELQ